MTRKIQWLVVSCLMVAALWLAACAPAVTEEPVTEEPVTPVTQEPVTQEPVTKEPVAAPEGTEMVRDVNGKLVPKPQYGGVLNQVTPAPRTYWNMDLDSIPGPMYEGALGYDWTRGPAGTGEWAGLYIAPIPFDMIVGRLAESWEMPDANTMIFKIRQGVHFQDESVMKGREMTAYDVEYSLRRLWTVPTSYNVRNYAASTHFINASVNDGIVATDKWTVVLKSQEGRMAKVFEMGAFRWGNVVGPEIEDYDMNDWKNAGGTGPFVLVDYVSGSAETYKRNDNYWQMDPLHPQNRLPYLDGVKILVMEDPSTRLAALRTGRVDLLGGRSSADGALEWEDTAAVRKSNPELGYKNFEPDAVPALYMRVDKPELAWYDVKVRRALAMAIDNQELIDELYGGNAALLAWPAVQTESPHIYIPLKEYPEVVQKMFGYYPDEAKQLLVDAGYPDGFTAEVITRQKDVDLLSLIADYWKKNLNVTMDIQVRESAVFTSIGSGQQHKEMYMREVLVSGGGRNMVNVRIGRPTANFSAITDPYPEQVFEEYQKSYFEEEKNIPILQEAYPYILEQAWLIQLPNPYVYTLWQPWLHNYEGAWHVEYGGTAQGDFQEYVWLDRDLKEQMTGRR